MGLSEAPVIADHADPTGKPSGAPTPRPPKLSGQARKRQLIRVATGLFAQSGLHGATTQALARAAGVSEPTLYIHFGSKELLFREAVETNIESRLRALERRLASLDEAMDASLLVEMMAKETIGVCVGPGTNSIIMNWALLEAPEFALDLHRGEAGAVELMWECVVKRTVSRSPFLAKVLFPLIPQGVSLCLAYGLWLSALRHTPATARELVCQYARVLSWMACYGPDGMAGRREQITGAENLSVSCRNRHFASAGADERQLGDS